MGGRLGNGKSYPCNCNQRASATSLMEIEYLIFMARLVILLVLHKVVHQTEVHGKCSLMQKSMTATFFFSSRAIKMITCVNECTDNLA